MKVSLLHHWLVSMRGGEKVLEQFCHLFPEADIHALVATGEPEALSETIRSHYIYTTLLNMLPRSEQIYPKLLPLYPLAIGRHRVEADFVLSSDAGMSKGMKLPEGVPHVCYCHSPPRYLWDMQQEYLDTMGAASRTVLRLLTPWLRRFDRTSADRVDHFIANSAFVQERIRAIYGRESEVIHPPVNLDGFEPSDEIDDYYLMVSALVPYKRVDLAVEAFNRLGRRLIIVGSGSERDRLTAMAQPNVELAGPKTDAELKQLYARCKAFIFPGVEDFGITPLEAQASGRPVIAYARGGALETVIPNQTGLFFQEQSADSLCAAVEEFESDIDSFSAEQCRANAEKFSPQRFRQQILRFLQDRYPDLRF
jgi:glycosyltransferase involved in cell wall biosynthesis